MGIIPHINQVRWWDKDDMNSRIKAFDYLIRVYTDKVNKSVIKTGLVMENITVNGFNIRIDRISSLGEALWVRKNFFNE